MNYHKYTFLEADYVENMNILQERWSFEVSYNTFIRCRFPAGHCSDKSTEISQTCRLVCAEMCRLLCAETDYKFIQI